MENKTKKTNYYFAWCVIAGIVIGIINQQINTHANRPASVCPSVQNTAGPF